MHATRQVSDRSEHSSPHLQDVLIKIGLFLWLSVVSSLFPVYVHGISFVFLSNIIIMTMRKDLFLKELFLTVVMSQVWELMDAVCKQSKPYLRLTLLLGKSNCCLMTHAGMCVCCCGTYISLIDIPRLLTLVLI